MIKQKRNIFLLLSFGLSWSVALIFWLGTDDIRTTTPGFQGMALIFMFMPMVAALLVQKVIYKQPVVKPLGVSFRLNRWWWIAWLLPPLLSLAALGVSLLFPGVHYTPDMSGLMDLYSDMLSPEQLAEMEGAELPANPLLIGFFSALMAGATINAVAGFGEELGWRGLLYDTLKSLTFWRASLVTGVIWGVWHTPVILMGHNYPGYPVIGLLMMIAWCILLSPLFTLIRLKSRSVIAAAILHGTLNGSYGLSILLISGSSVLLTGMTGLAGFIVLVLVNLLIYIFWPETRHHSLAELEPVLERQVAK